MELVRWTFEAIGTGWQIDFVAHSKEHDAEVRTTVAARIEEFDKTYSRFRADSLVTCIAQEAGTYTFPEDAAAIFAEYRKLYELTDGAVTPLIGQTLSDAGYDAQYTLTPKTLIAAPIWDEVLSYEHPVLTTRQPVLLDFGAAGKGYLVDIVAALFIAEGIEQFCINAGGDVRYHSTDKVPLRIGLEHPDRRDSVIGVATIDHGSICGSSGNRRAWTGYTHIINPTTLQSPTHIRALWTYADSALVADALATALFFMSPVVLSTAYTFEYLIVYEDFVFERTDNFPAELFTAAP